MRLIFGGRNREVYDLFEEDGANILRAAELLEEMLGRWPEENGTGREIVICEKEGDRITHDLLNSLNTQRSGALDGDLRQLAAALDDVVDQIEEVADFMGLYQIEAPMEQAYELAAVLVEGCRETAAAVASLDNIKAVGPHIVEINRLENEGDRIFRSALASLFSDGVDPMAVVRWKDIFSGLELAIDNTERVSHILEGIRHKKG